MNIVYYTSGITGSGRIVTGISVGNALKRKIKHINYTILSHSKFARLADEFNHIEIQVENEIQLSKDNYKSSLLYKSLIELKPDVLIVDHSWFNLHSFIEELKCIKIYLSTQVFDKFFSIPLKNGYLEFNPDYYDFVFAIEPFKSTIKMKQLNPFIMRNKNEILSRKDALLKLDLPSNKKNCLLAINGHPGDFERIKKTYSYLEDAGYEMTYTTNYKGGIFPVVDYFNAFDQIICSAGYNSFWEAVYFDKETILVPAQTVFESQQKRIDECLEYKFKENGADQLVDILLERRLDLNPA